MSWSRILRSQQGTHLWQCCHRTDIMRQLNPREFLLEHLQSRVFVSRILAQTYKRGVPHTWRAPGSLSHKKINSCPAYRGLWGRLSKKSQNACTHHACRTTMSKFIHNVHIKFKPRLNSRHQCRNSRYRTSSKPKSKPPAPENRLENFIECVKWQLQYNWDFWAWMFN